MYRPFAMAAGVSDSEPPDISSDHVQEISGRMASKRKQDIDSSNLSTPTPKIPATQPGNVAAAIQTIYTHPHINNKKRYSDCDNGPFIVHLSRVEDDLVAGSSIRAIKVGQMLHTLKINNITKDGIKNIGRNRVSIEFKTADDANNFLLNPAVSDHKFVASIPSYNITRMGIARGVPIDINMEELATASETPANCGQIIKARRLHRKAYKNDTVEWIPTQSVVLTFSGQILPSKIFLYYSSLPIENYILPTIQCFKCCRFGHIKDQCRAKPRCYRCAGDHTGDTCERTPSCLHCSGNHQAVDNNCPEYKRQKSIKLVMSQESISYSDAAARFPAVRRPYAEMATEMFSPPRSLPSQAKSQNPSIQNPSIQNPHQSFRKTVSIPRNLRTKSLDRGYDKLAHSQIINDPAPSLSNGSAYPVGLSSPDDNLLYSLLNTLTSILCRFNDALPNNVILQLEKLSKLASHNGSVHSAMELQEP